jgi:hypothetical protein
LASSYRITNRGLQGRAGVAGIKFREHRLGLPATDVREVRRSSRFDPKRS